MARDLLPDLISDRPFTQLANLWPNLFAGNVLSDDFSIKGVRIYEENNQLHVEVPVPGLSLDDIEVSLNKGVLWIKGELKEEEKDKKRNFYRFSKRSYSSSIPLPAQIDEKQEPQAVYEDGILKVSLQLAKQAETKKIKVKSGNKKK